MQLKLKHIIAASAVFVCASTAHAQSAGSFILNAGWTYFMPQNEGGSFGKNVGVSKYSGYKRGSEDFVWELNELANGGLKAGRASAFGLSGTYFITDNLAGELVLSTSSKLSLKGTGELAQFGKLGSVRQWSPTLLLKYYFLQADDKFRPYLGIGASRTWLSQARMDLPMAVPGTTALSINNQLSWSPVVNGGFTYQFSERLYGTLSVSYMQLEADVKLRTNLHYEDRNQSTNWTRSSSDKIKLNPITTFVGIGYRF